MSMALVDSDEASEGEGLWPLPEGWAWARLGDLGAWSGGGTPSKSVTSYWTGGSIPWVSPKDMKSEIVTDTEDKITEEAVQNSATKFIPPNSLLMVMRSGILRHTFPVAVTRDRVTLNQDLRALSPFDGIEARFVANYLRLIQNVILHDCSKDGTTVQSIEVPALEKVPVPISPLSEQRRIVARIDELFAEIAEGEAALARARAGLDTWRRALLKAAVTGELTRDWREAQKKSDTGVELLARICGAGEQLHTRRSNRFRRDESKSRLMSALPEGWSWTTLGKLLSHMTSGSRDWAQFYDRGNATFVMAQNIRPGRYNHSYVKRVDPPVGDVEALRTRIQKNDLLVTIVGANTGDLCRVDFDPSDFYVCQSVALLRPSIPDIAEFLEIYFVAPDGGRGEFEKVIYGAGRPHLSFDQLLQTPVPLPGISEIHEIVRRVREEQDRMVGREKFDVARRDIATLRQSILKSAFEGGLVPQDPTDEPASAVLARLRAERAEQPAAKRRGRARTAQ